MFPLPTAPTRNRGEPTDAGGATFLARGVMAAQVTLTHLVMVRPHAGQPRMEWVGLSHREAAAAALRLL